MSQIQEGFFDVSMLETEVASINRIVKSKKFAESRVEIRLIIMGRSSQSLKMNVKDCEQETGRWCCWQENFSLMKSVPNKIDETLGGIEDHRWITVFSVNDT